MGSLNRKDITNEYKFAENSVLERASVRKAFKKSGNESLKITPKVIEMKVRPENTAIEIGDDLVVVANIKNLGEKERKATVVLGGNIVRYNGVAKGDLMNHKYRATLPSNEGKQSLSVMICYFVFNLIHRFVGNFRMMRKSVTPQKITTI